MSSVSKRRRDRIRAKQQHGYDNTDNPIDENQFVDDEVNENDSPRRPRSVSPPPDQHVVPADGRQARLRRKKLQKEARHFEEDETSSVGLTPIPSRDPIKPKRKSLRERRAERRRQRLRRDGNDPDRPDERVRPMGVVWISWRWLSGTLTIILLAVLYVMLFSDLFYIQSMAVGGERYLSPEEVFQASGLANKHLFWVDPQAVATQLEENPSIVDAQVFIGWPPNMVSILISERDPLLVWEQGNFRVWVDANGTVMFQREERPDLLRIINTASEEPLGVGARIDQNIVAGALQLRNIYPNIDTLRYDPVKGLGYQDGRNWTVWFGTGTNMEMKAKVYDTIVRVNYPGIQFLEVDLSDSDHPYFVDRFPE